MVQFFAIKVLQLNLRGLTSEVEKKEIGP